VVNAQSLRRSGSVSGKDLLAGDQHRPPHDPYQPATGNISGCAFWMCAIANQTLPPSGGFFCAIMNGRIGSLPNAN